MRVAICGGGPAGLYFALLLKKRFPRYDIIVYEQNAAAATYGWGIVFSERAQTFLRDGDAESFEDFERAMVSWDDLTIVHRDTPMRVDGSSFSAIARAKLLDILKVHCERSGVELRFLTRIVRLEDLGAADLVVVADGAKSTLRRALSDRLRARSTALTNKYIWYGTRRLFPTLTLTFREFGGGFFVGHSYPYSGDHSSFTVECDSGTWARAGFDSMSEEESRAYCEKVFAADLEGHEFLSNKSVWSNFVVNATERWWTGNVAVIGDAARTIHFSIGSGTRSAMEDAIWLASSIEPDRPLEASLKEYEARRGEASRRLLEVAERSYTWYEEFPSHMPLAPWDFAYSYMTRSGHVTEAGMMKRSPKFYAEYRASR